MITSAQMRAARGLIGISQTKLAESAGLSVPTIKRMELRGPGVSSMDNVQAVISALEGQGVSFIQRDEAGGDGVRLRE